MRMHFLITFVFMVTGFEKALGAESVIDGQSNTPAVDAGAENLTEMQLNGLKSFFESCLKKKFTAVQVINRSNHSSETSRPTIRLKAGGGAEEEVSMVELDSSGEKVLSYGLMRRSRSLAGIKGLTAKDAIAREVAFQAAVPILKYYGLSQRSEEYEMWFNDAGEESEQSASSERDLWGCSWWIRKQFDYQGIPCRDARITVVVSAYSGQIERFKYVSVTVPAAPSREITKEEAVEAAKKWLAESTYFVNRKPTLDGDVVDKTLKVISIPNHAFVVEERQETRSDMLQSFYCWEVPFHYAENEHVFKGYLWVNVDTGQVVGGGE